ncbi:hypothetical protein MMC31_000582 [Peltigera leucophlebia]|nr:hypothetical protein [Peltigera leucophlebia]
MLAKEIKSKPQHRQDRKDGKAAGALVIDDGEVQISAVTVRQGWKGKEEANGIDTVHISYEKYQSLTKTPAQFKQDEERKDKHVVIRQEQVRSSEISHISYLQSYSEHLDSDRPGDGRARRRGVREGGG